MAEQEGEPRPDYRLTLRPLPGAAPAVVRLRRLLKSLLRAYGFRALAVEELARADDRGPQLGGDDATGHSMPPL